MILAGIFQTVEFYVIVTVLAAAALAAVALPPRRREADLHLLAGILSADDEPGAVEPMIDITCRRDGSVVIVRRGLTGVYGDGAVSLAVKVAGFDIEVEERLTPGRGLEPAVTEATFVFDFLGQERYHLRYNSESVGRFAATGLHVRPGIHIVKELTQ